MKNREKVFCVQKQLANPVQTGYIQCKRLHNICKQKRQKLHAEKNSGVQQGSDRKREKQRETKDARKWRKKGGL